MLWLPCGMKASGNPRRMKSAGTKDASWNISRMALPNPPWRTFSSMVTTLPIFAGPFENEFFVQGFDKAGVQDRGLDGLLGQTFGCLERGLDRAANGNEQDVLALAEDFTLADGKSSKGAFHEGAHPVPARIAQGNRARVVQGRLQHVLKLVFIFGRHEHHVGDMAEEGKVENPMVRGTVVTHNAPAVHGENDGEILQADILDDLVVSTLEERRIDGHNGLEPFAGQSGGKRHRVLLGYADVEKPLRKPFGELLQPGALNHGRRNGHDLLIGFGQAGYGFPEHLGVGEGGLGPRGRGDDLAAGDVEGADPVKARGVRFSRKVPPAFLGHHVDQDRAVDFTRSAEGIDETVHAMPLDRADVMEVQGLEQHPRRKERHQQIFATPEQVNEIGSNAGNGLEVTFHVPPEVEERLVGQLAAEE